MYRKRILVADGDPGVVRLLRTNLDARGYVTCTAMDGAEALQALETQRPDLVILDAALPIIDGVELCRRTRGESPAPVIMLGTSRDQQHKVRCLDNGADDYIAKPFGVEELLASVRVIFRRAQTLPQGPASDVFRAGDIEVHFAERNVTSRGREVGLTPTEYSLLQELALNADKVVTHKQLLQRIWGPEFGNEREYLRVVIGRLRRKLEPEPSRPMYLLTVPWVGYKLRTASEKVQEFNSVT